MVIYGETSSNLMFFFYLESANKNRQDFGKIFGMGLVLCFEAFLACLEAMNWFNKIWVFSRCFESKFGLK
jgi:hypothetical protein